MLTEDDGTSREYLELMPPYATNHQAVGRYYYMIIILMLFVMLYCNYRTGEVQHASLKASIWSKTEEALNFVWSMLF